MDVVGECKYAVQPSGQRSEVLGVLDRDPEEGYDELVMIKAVWISVSVTLTGTAC